MQGTHHKTTQFYAYVILEGGMWLSFDFLHSSTCSRETCPAAAPAVDDAC